MAALVGIDGCPGGWVAAVADSLPGPIEFLAETRLLRLLERIGETEVAAIDMPIGLPTRGRRRCDEEARRLLGARRSTLFFAPPACVLESASHAEACEAAAAATGSKISIQSWNLVPKIKEVAEAIRRRSPEHRLIETHPELGFAAMSDGVALDESKKTLKGRERRKQLLANRFGREALERALADQSRLNNTRRIPIEDRLDALACLSSAWRISSRTCVRLPSTPAPGEATIVY